MAIIDLIFVLFFSVRLFSSGFGSYNDVIDIILNWLGVAFAFPAFIMLYRFVGDSAPSPSPLDYFLIGMANITIYFLIGACFGWLYGEIKRIVQAPRNR